MVGMLVGAIVAAGETSSHLEQGIISSSLALQELWLGKSILS
jgi:hypothetical protein